MYPWNYKGTCLLQSGDKQQHIVEEKTWEKLEWWRRNVLETKYRSKPANKWLRFETSSKKKEEEKYWLLLNYETFEFEICWTIFLHIKESYWVKWALLSVTQGVRDGGGAEEESTSEQDKFRQSEGEMGTKGDTFI